MQHFLLGSNHNAIIILCKFGCIRSLHISEILGAQWFSGRVLDSRPRARWLEPYPRHCVVSLSKNINPSLVLVQPRKTRPCLTERLLLGRKESSQANIRIFLMRFGYTRTRSVLDKCIDYMEK